MHSINWRRGAALGATALLAGALVACSSTGTPGASGGGGDARTIGFINGADNEWGTCLQKGVEAEAGAEDVTLVTANSASDPAKEISNVEDMIAQQVDAIVLNTVSVDALVGGVAKAKEAGIPIYLVAVVPDDMSDVLGATVVDLPAAGALAAGWIEKDAASAEVQVAIIAGAPGAASDFVVDGFSKALPGNATVVADQPGMFDRTKAGDVAENIIQATPDLDYAFVLNEDMAFGARTAFDSAGHPDVRIVTLNGTDPGLAAIEDGQFSATVSDSAAQLGSESLKNAIALLGDSTADKIAQKPITLITKENLADATPFCG